MADVYAKETTVKNSFEAVKTEMFWLKMAVIGLTICIGIVGYLTVFS